MTILEARKAAEEGKTVISPGGVEWSATNFKKLDDDDIRGDWVFGEWKLKTEPRKPREIWVNEYQGMTIRNEFFESERQADKAAEKTLLENDNARIACRKFIEMVDNE